jgi:ATP/maltotriose-dependent transcriptional regulator MalT
MNAALLAARDPKALPSKRISDATTALSIASNTGEMRSLESAYRAVNAVRHSSDVANFDVYRADVIYHATTGDKARAVQSADLLCETCRELPDIHLACKGLRNASEVFATFGELGRAQAILLESRQLAARLEYSKQVAWADIRLADLALESMDMESAQEYLRCAAEIVERHRLSTPLLVVDLHVQLCWQAIVRGDQQSAARSAKFVTKKILRAYSGTGTAYWTALSVKLATRQGAFSREHGRAFDALRQSIGSRPYYPNEHVSLAALLIAAKQTGQYSATTEFVSSQVPRFEANGRRIWQFVARML